jgi:nitroreductase
MSMIEGMKQRRSIRGFKPDPVSKDKLRIILEAACQAPSAMNTQPWEFLVIGGDRLARIKQTVLAKLKAGEPMSHEHSVVGWPKDSVYRTRQVDLAKQIFKHMDIAREDKVKREQWLERGFRLFDAPVGIVLLTDKVLGEAGPLLDLGAVMQNICLAALDFGLGTCIEDQAVSYPEVIREHIDIPENKRIVIAIAIGYPDWDFPANKVVCDREPIDRITTWIGMD